MLDSAVRHQLKQVILNSKKLATDFAAKAKKNGIVAKVVGTDQYRFSDLSREEFLFIIISTHGEGDPPDAAKKFYDYIHTEHLQLSKLNYAVLALGDTSYPLFCKTGEDVDAQLKKLGGKRVIAVKKCDGDTYPYIKSLKSLTTTKVNIGIIDVLYSY